MLMYQAPLEGITGYIYRKAIFQYFGGVDKYFSPFISPYEKRIITNKERHQLCPDNNPGFLVPQIMTTNAEGFLQLTNLLFNDYGYKEFNLNFGCPSGTVVSKGRGAGSLRDLDALKLFLDNIMSATDLDISIKTRLGLHNVDEFEEILELFNQYKLKELIIHPRIRDEFYRGLPHKDLYAKACLNSSNPLVYNGDIKSKEDFTDLSELSNPAYDKFSKPCKEEIMPTHAIMIGRGMVENPAIFRVLTGGNAATSLELNAFLTQIEEAYLSEFSGETPVLYKLKEIWSYMGNFLIKEYNVNEKIIKKLIKTKKISEYRIYKNEILKEF